MKNQEKKDPFEGCVLHEMAKRGERFEYVYPNNGLPKVGEPRVGVSFFHRFYDEYKKKNGL